MSRRVRLGHSMTETILVTGSSGFVGTTYCERLSGNRLNRHVFAVDRSAPREKFPGITYFEADLAEKATVERLMDRIRPDFLVHLAAQSRVAPSIADPFATFESNILATTNLSWAFNRLPPDSRRFVYASSEAVYGPQENLPSPEDAHLNPQNPYAASKAAAELVVRSGLPDHHVIVRSGMGFGPRSNPNQQVVARFISQVLDEHPLLVPVLPRGVRHPTRDINFVGNFIDGLELIRLKRPQGTFNLASGSEVPIDDLAEQVIRVLGRGQVRRDMGFVYRHGETNLRIWLDISKARRLLGYRPAVPLARGISVTAKWIENNRSYWDETGKKADGDSSRQSPI